MAMVVVVGTCCTTIAVKKAFATRPDVCHSLAGPRVVWWGAADVKILNSCGAKRCVGE